MLDILQAPNHVAAFRLSGVVTTDDYERMIAELDSKLQLYPRIAVYTELAPPLRVTLRALFRDLRYDVAKLGEWHRFARVTMVSDASPWRAFFRIAHTLIPAFEARVFPRAERDAALRWASELSQDSPQRSGLRLIATTRPDTYAFVWNGKVTRSDAEHVLGVMKSEFQSRASVRVFGRIEDMGGIELGALLQTSLLRLKLLAPREVERYAIVSGPRWIPRYVRWVRRLTGVDARHFERAEEDAAWSWLEARPVAAAESPLGQLSTAATAHPRTN